MRLSTVAGQGDLNIIHCSHDTRIVISDGGTAGIASTDGESGISDANAPSSMKAKPFVHTVETVIRDGVYHFNPNRGH